MGKKKPVIVRDLQGNILNRFESVQKAADFFGASHPNVLYWIRMERVKDEKVFAFENPEDTAHHTNYGMYHRKIKHVEDVELDKENYMIVPYEVKFMRVSITPCPYREYPKPMVGSAACQACPLFKWIDRKAHEVSCNTKGKYEVR